MVLTIARSLPTVVVVVFGEGGHFGGGGTFWGRGDIFEEGEGNTLITPPKLSHQ